MPCKGYFAKLEAWLLSLELVEHQAYAHNPALQFECARCEVGHAWVGERFHRGRFVMNSTEPRVFETPAQLEIWLEANHEPQRELWVRIFKKDSGSPSVTWNDCVVTALSWGWIDGQRKSLDQVSFLQRLTPRRPKSNWSKRNCEHAERLILEGRM
jgi:hypothetical protein